MLFFHVHLYEYLIDLYHLFSLDNASLYIAYKCIKRFNQLKIENGLSDFSIETGNVAKICYRTLLLIIILLSLVVM